MMAGTPKHNNIDDKSGLVGMSACRSVDMSGLLRSSIRKSGTTTTKRVTISDDIDTCYDVVPYSECYPVPPKSFVIGNKR